MFSHMHASNHSIYRFVIDLNLLFATHTKIFKHKKNRGMKIAMHLNEKFALGLFFSPAKFSWVNWAVHNFMHEIFTHENLWAKFSFSCMKCFVQELTCFKQVA